MTLKQIKQPNNPNRKVKIGEAVKLLGVSRSTLREWERRGYLCPMRIGIRGDRYYTLGQLAEKVKRNVVL